MTNNDKIRFIENICNSVKKEIKSKIENNKTPENWDGIELRELLKIKFGNESYYFEGKKKQKRYKDFINTCIVENL